MEGRKINMNPTNIVHAWVVFAVYLFIMILLYFTLSAPVDAIMDGLSNAPLGEAEDEMALHSPNFNCAIKVAFACGIATQLTWIVMWVFSKEPYIGVGRR